jgi:hypothetical protein
MKTLKMTHVSYTSAPVLKPYALFFSGNVYVFVSNSRGLGPEARADPRFSRREGVPWTDATFSAPAYFLVQFFPTDILLFFN